MLVACVRKDQGTCPATLHDSLIVYVTISLSMLLLSLYDYLNYVPSIYIYTPASLCRDAYAFYTLYYTILCYHTLVLYYNY